MDVLMQGFVVMDNSGSWHEEWRTGWWCWTGDEAKAMDKARELNKLNPTNAPFKVKVATMEIEL